MTQLRILNFIAISVLAVVSLAAQAPPPPMAPPRPPPPKVAITGTQVVPKTAVFTSAEGGFQVGFPRRPQRTVVPIDSSFGKTEMVNYSLPTGLAHYGVAYLDFPTVMTDKYDLNVRFDAMRDAQVARMSGRVSSDVEVNFGSRYGRETVVEGESTSLSMRAIVAGPRLYVLMVETRGRLSTQSERLRNANIDRVKKFFDSFVITKETRPSEVRVDFPADFGVTVGNGVFTSDYFGATLTLPEGWIVIEDEDAETLFEVGKESLEKTDPKLASYITDENARLLAMIAKNDPSISSPEAVISILAERTPYPNFKARAVAETYIKLYLDPTETVVKEISTINIGGTEFAWFETFDSDGEVLARMFFANRKGIAFEVVFSYTDEKDLPAMMRSLNSLKFN